VTDATIRAAHDGDRPELERLMDEFQGELASMDPYGRVIHGRGYGRFQVGVMFDDADENDGAVLVAEREGAIVGFAAGAIRTREDAEALSVVDFRDGEIAELYVIPDARSSGVATALIEAFERRFADAGCTAVRIEVFAPNAVARRLYAGLGYAERDLYLLKPLD